MKTTICDLCKKPIYFDFESGNWKIKFRKNISAMEMINKAIVNTGSIWTKVDICANCKNEIIKYLKERENLENENK